MTTATGWTSLVATFATLCAGVCGARDDGLGAEAARNAVVIALGASAGWTEPLTIDCMEHNADEPRGWAVLHYEAGSRHARRWGRARVPASVAMRVGDHVRFDPDTCAVLPAGE